MGGSRNAQGQVLHLLMRHWLDSTRCGRWALWKAVLRRQHLRCPTSSVPAGATHSQLRASPAPIL